MTGSRPTESTSCSPPQPLPGSGLEAWSLADDMTFLNHGSFGARALEVVEEQLRIKGDLDADPADLLWVRGDEPMKAARVAIAGFLGVDADDLVSVVNSTEGVNAVVRSLDLRAGQSIVATGHGYNAITQALRYVTDRCGASLRIVDLHPPLPDESGLVEAVLSAVDEDTALVVIDHVTSPTAMCFPVEEIVAACHDRGVRVMVDGAHGPGMLDLDVSAIGADYYTGNFHKWVSAPLGSAFLHVSRSCQDEVHPLSISHFFTEGFQREFCWLGTRDCSAFLATPHAIEWFERCFGWAAVRRHNRDLVAWAANRACEAWSVEPLDVPASSAMTSMRTIMLPDVVRRHFDEVEHWRDWLRREHRIDVAVHDWADRWWIRLSAHVYNRPEHYDRLIDVGLSFAAG